MVDSNFSSMSDEWRKEYADRLSTLLVGSALSPDARASILKQLPKICAGATAVVSDIEELRESFATLVPSVEELQAGSIHAASYLEAFVREAVIARPLTSENRSAALTQLKSLEDHAVRLIDERMVGDRPARELVAQSVRQYFRDYERDVGDPLRPFFSRPLTSEELAGVMARMSEAIPAGKQFDLSGLGSDRAQNTFLLNERGVNELIYEVAVIKMYLSVHKVSLVDPRNREKLVAAEAGLLKWRDQIRRDLTERAEKQGLSAQARAQLRQLLDPEGAAEVHPPVKPAPSATAPPVSARKPVESDSRPASRAPMILGGIAVLAVVLIVAIRRTRSRAP